MVLQLANIIGGALLSSTFIKEKVKSPQLDALFAKAAPYEAGVGVVVFVLGVVGLIQRFGVFYVFSGASFPQAIPAILVGLLLGVPFLGHYAFLKKATDALTPYATWIGLLGILCGLGSLLFGCILPFACSPW